MNELKEKTTINAGIYIYAGIKTWSTRNEGDDLIECGKLESGKVEFGTLKETGIINEIKVGDVVDLCHNGKKMKVKVCEI